ncbi:MAG: phosphatase PAP2/dual specificity phosphatase family protein [Candidatus Accumulibacter sp.]|jgi:protein-tyrosine phosphatase/membrane-associated phospholipid phosphatase|nr:phosphatase PAP2/dual specificity phosphatase family protein [Accumulibacter sp.]
MPPAVETSRLSGAFKRGVLWLLFLGPFFFLSYGFANHQSALRDAATGVASFYYSWERGIPLWPWTILPYWSIDLLYGFAFLCCRDRAETKRLGLRLLSAQLICVACFLAWPLRFDFERPPVEGLSGALFTALASFDLPYNQAPSLHITLLVIVWRQFAGVVDAPAVRGLIHAWAVLIALSVLTTWQHHFIDVPTGLAAGLVCLWLWPDEGRLRPANDRRWTLAFSYFLGAALFLAAALSLGGAAAVCAWPALSLALVAFNYAGAGAAGFQKHCGRHSLAARWLFLPYTCAAWVNSRLWTRGFPEPDRICDGVWLGRMPTAREFEAWAKKRGGDIALFDLCAELPAPALPVGAAYDGLPCLDLVSVPTSALMEAARRLDALRATRREVWVACALGYSRSAAVVAAWLLQTGRAADASQALALLRKARPRVALGAKSLARLEECTALPQGAS